MALRRLKLFQLRRVRWRLVRIELNAPDARARVGYCFERRLLEVRRPCNGVHQIRNQIRAALIDVLHLGPLGIDVLLQADETIITSRNRDSCDDQNENDDEHNPPQPMANLFMGSQC